MEGDKNKEMKMGTYIDLVEPDISGSLDGILESGKRTSCNHIVGEFGAPTACQEIFFIKY